MAYFRCSSGSGGSGGYSLLKTEQMQFTNKVGSLSGLTSGKEYMIIFSWGWSNTNEGADTKISTMTNTTNLTRVDSGQEGNGTVYCNTYWSIYTFKATGTTSTVTKTNQPNSVKGRYFLFEKA